MAGDRVAGVRLASGEELVARKETVVIADAPSAGADAPVKELAVR